MRGVKQAYHVSFARGYSHLGKTDRMDKEVLKDQAIGKVKS